MRGSCPWLQAFDRLQELGYEVGARSHQGASDVMTEQRNARIRVGQSSGGQRIVDEGVTVFVDLGVGTLGERVRKSGAGDGDQRERNDEERSMSKHGGSLSGHACACHLASKRLFDASYAKRYVGG